MKKGLTNVPEARSLVADGVGFHIPRGYVYFAIAFSLFVEILNSALQNRRRRESR